MRITLTTPEQRDQLAAHLGATTPAAIMSVADTVAAASGVHRSGRSGHGVGLLLAADTLALTARLIEAERVLDITRRTLATAATSDHHHSVSDLLWELTQAGVGISDDELDAAEERAEAEATAEALR
ncbi:hypothetical protein [Streptomyces sp. DT171]|uniref:hypothetical protein n=1 Tax=Streptomyces sp. DT171 TaxID=3416524 RepID=UPI003CF53A5F